MGENLRVKGRATWLGAVAEMPRDPDVYVDTRSRNRLHGGDGMKGQTSYQVFRMGSGSPGVARSKPRKT